MPAAIPILVAAVVTPLAGATVAAVSAFAASLPVAGYPAARP